jgi:hypothetical protein
MDPKNTVGNSTVRSEDTAKWTKGDSTDNTPKTKGTKDEDFDWRDDDAEEEWAGCKLKEFKSGQQQFPVWSKPPLDSELKYLGEMEWTTALSLFDSYTSSINQPWQRTPYHEKNQFGKTNGQEFKHCSSCFMN